MELHSELSSGKYGKLFLEEIKKEIEKMYADPSPLGRDTPSGYEESDYYDWLAPAVRVLIQGYEAGEGEAMFLLANVCRYHDGYYDDLLDWLEETQIGSQWEMYRQAAMHGSARAKLWLHYAAEQHLTDQMLDISGIELPASMDVRYPELAFLKETILKMQKDVSELDFLEDMCVDRNEPVPDPSWRSLHLRSVELAFFMCWIGLDDITEPYWPEDGWFDFAEVAAVVKKEQEQWRAWIAQLPSGCDAKEFAEVDVSTQNAKAMPEEERGIEFVSAEHQEPGQAPFGKSVIVYNLILLFGAIVMGVSGTYLFASMGMRVLTALVFAFSAYFITFSVKNIVQTVAAMIICKREKPRR